MGANVGDGINGAAELGAIVLCEHFDESEDRLENFHRKRSYGHERRLNSGAAAKESDARVPDFRLEIGE